MIMNIPRYETRRDGIAWEWWDSPPLSAIPRLPDYQITNYRRTPDNLFSVAIATHATHAIPSTPSTPSYSVVMLQKMEDLHAWQGMYSVSSTYSLLRTVEVDVPYGRYLYLIIHSNNTCYYLLPSAFWCFNAFNTLPTFQISHALPYHSFPSASSSEPSLLQSQFRRNTRSDSKAVCFALVTSR